MRFTRKEYLQMCLKCVCVETELARNLKVVVARMNEENSSNGAERGSSSGEDSDESDVETVQEPVERAAEDSDTEAEQDTASPK